MTTQNRLIASKIAAKVYEMAYAELEAADNDREQAAEAAKKARAYPREPQRPLPRDPLFATPRPPRPPTPPLGVSDARTLWADATAASPRVRPLLKRRRTTTLIF